MRLIPFSEIDNLLSYFDEGYRVSHDEAYRRFSQVSLSPPEDLPEDPFSSEYSGVFMDLYKKVSNRADYSVENERAAFDIDYHVRRPYPYFTKSLKRTAQHYDLMAKLFDMMDVPPGADILECGFGWGNTTLALAMVGHNVTALDIEGKYCELVQRRADLLEVSNVRFVNSDFLWVETTDQKFDAVVYFESFHHCWEFDRLLKALHRVLKPGGQIYFGAEPINDGFTVPWGVRLDGESLFVARRCGWMELGFRIDFFHELLRRNGWRGMQVSTHFWKAVRRADPIVIPAADARLKSQFGVLEGDRLKISPLPDGSGRHFGLYGPYIDLPAGTYDCSVTLDTDSYDAGSVTLDLCSGMGAKIHGETQLDAGALRSGSISVRLATDVDVRQLECRLNLPPTFSGAITALTITEVMEERAAA